MDNVNQALIIAKRDLKACYGNKGIYAGLHQFKNYWARDSLFASLGALSINDFNIVKINLELYLRFAKKSGQIPFRVGPNIITNFIGLKSKFIPRYANDKSKKVSVDQNSLLIICAYNYVKASNDKDFLTKYLDNLEKIMLWNFTNDTNNNNLIEENYYCNWADTIKKRGTVLYTNICHCHALFCLSELFKQIKNKVKHDKYKILYNEVKYRINHDFWSGEHYIDWIEKDKQYNYFSTDGNILSIIWDIADKIKAKHIEEASQIYDVNDIPSGCVHPKYPSNLISPSLKLIGLGDYHNGLSWIWLGSLNALAKYKLGMQKEANIILSKISDMIIKHKQVYEIYDSKGNPIKRLIYKSEYPFAWSAGLFLYAANKILK